MCDADLSIVPIMADEEGLNIFSLAGLLDKRGWNMFTSSKPPCMSVCIGERHSEVLEYWVTDLKECIAQLRADPSIQPEGDGAIYGQVDTLPDNIIETVMRGFVDIKMTTKPLKRA